MDDAGNVSYTGTITVGYGVENYVYHDTMGTGLAFKAGSVKVTVGGAEVDAESNYDLITTGLDGETFNVKFENEYIAGLAEGTMINIEYKATINTNVLTANPENNSAYLSYGNNDDIDSTPVV